VHNIFIKDYTHTRCAQTKPSVRNVCSFCAGSAV